MERLFAMLLRLYPAGHQELLGEEMLRVFEQAAAEHRARGRLAFTRFLIAEVLGLLRQAAAAWRWQASEDAFDLRKMRPPEVSKEQYVTAIDEVLAAQRRAAANLRRMQDAIGRHEFVKARFYSDEERRAREHLRLIHKKYRIAE